MTEYKVPEQRKEFEQWYSKTAFDFARHPFGSRDCCLQWAAWQQAYQAGRDAMKAEADEWKSKYEKEYNKVIATGIVAINSLPPYKHEELNPNLPPYQPGMKRRSTI